MSDILDGLLAAVGDRDVVAEVSVRRRHQQEIRARDGALDTCAGSVTTSAWLRVWAHGGESTLTVTGLADPRRTIDLACALARTLPPRPALPPPSGLASTGSALPPARAEDGPEPLDRVAQRLSGLVPGPGEEVWVSAFDDHLLLGRSGGQRLRHRRRLVAANVRVVREGRHGRAHSSQSAGAASVAELLRGPLPAALVTARAEAAALGGARSAGKPGEPVVLSPAVAAALLGLAVHGFLADAVLERHSMLADRVGEPVASELVTVVDDPTMPGAPLAAPIDDEGSLTRATTLVERGRLRGFLSDRRAAERLPGAVPGAGWSAQGDTPAPGPSNFCLLADPAAGGGPAATGGRRVLEIVQSHGMHIANPVTGAFSFGGAAIVREDGEAAGAVPHLTVAGNVYDLLREVRAVGGDLRFVVGSAAFGSPSLAVEGLSIGC